MPNSQAEVAPHQPWMGRIGIIMSIALLGVAAYSLVRIARDLSPDQIWHAMRATSTRKLWLCGLLTGLSLAALGCYDVLAIRMIAPRRVSSFRAWFSGVSANAASNTLGFHAATATAMRYRLLHRKGLSGAEVAAVTAYSWSTLAFGFASVLSVALMVSPTASGWQRAVGLLLLGALLILARWLGPGRHVACGGREFCLPSGRMALGQMALGAVEMAAAIGALYTLMPAGETASFAEFSALYVGAVLLGIVSHAPGGIGVFEATVLAVSSAQERGTILVALLLYRVIYNLAPFALAALAFAADEILAAVHARAGRG